MPMVNSKKFPYTAKGKMQAKDYAAKIGGKMASNPAKKPTKKK